MPPKKVVKPKKADSDDEALPTRSTRQKKDDKLNTKTKAVAKKASPSPVKPKTTDKKKTTKKSPTPSPPKKDTKKGAKKPEPKKDEKKVDPKKDDPKTTDSKRPTRGKKAASPSPSPKKSPSPQKKVKEGEEEKKIKKIIVNGTAPVDEEVYDSVKYKVVEEGGVIYDLMMNQTNITGDRNNNKFYVCQVLALISNPNNFYFFTRWGRVGVPGQQAMQGPMTKDKAIREFNKKKHDKSDKGDYRILDKDYNFTDPAEAKKREEESYDKSKLHPKVKEFVRMIFDMKMMNNQMKEIGYDAEKMPLGKLAPSTIKKGFDVLKEIAKELENAKPSSARLAELTSEFYSQIPHNFGMARAPIVDSNKKVKEKLEMLESIQQIQVATKILDEQKEDTNVIDSNYEKLLTNINYLPETDEKVKMIREYIKNTHAATHANYTLEVFDVYEIQKDLDDKRFKKELGNRMLLWHGSRLTNFVGILSQGLRIAPPEAPVTGYMFGKGVYFADMVSKSANYCGTSRDNNVGLILLADVALGNTNEKFYSDYNASDLPAGKHSTHAKGKTAPPESSYKPFPGLPEVKVPIGKGGDSGVKNTSLLYNEYIVYDVAQIRLKYAIKLKWNYK